MITIETINIDGHDFKHTYSNLYKIRKIGTDEIYEDAIDALNFTYIETDILLEEKNSSSPIE